MYYYNLRQNTKKDGTIGYHGNWRLGNYSLIKDALGKVTLMVEITINEAIAKDYLYNMAQIVSADFRPSQTIYICGTSGGMYPVSFKIGTNGEIFLNHFKESPFASGETYGFCAQWYVNP